jgi:hypothetical protein
MWLLAAHATPIARHGLQLTWHRCCCVPSQEREDLFSSWRVDPLSKERKLQLVQKLWSRDSLAQPDGMQRSSELVVQLCGMDASEHMMELVFGKFQREQEVGGGGCTGVHHTWPLCDVWAAGRCACMHHQCMP